MARPLRATSRLTPAALVEYPPSTNVSDVTACTWEGDPAWTRRVRVLPDGSVDLIWDDTRLRAAGAAAVEVTHVVTAPTTGLRLRVGAAASLLGIPASAISADGIDLTAVWGADATRWERQLQDAPDRATARGVLEALVASRLVGGASDRLVQGAVGMIATGHGVEDVACRMGCSGRDLRRRFHREVGVGPKTLQRVLRFGRFVAALSSLAAGETSLAMIAPALGYVDQAHLTRECRTITETTPARLLARWSQHDDRGRNIQDLRLAHLSRSSAWPHH